MIKCFICLLLMSYSCSILSQEYDINWVLGYGTTFHRYEKGEAYGKFIVSFKSQLDTMPIYTSIPFCEMSFTTACISNKDGELIFFTDGNSIFGKEFGMAQNGDTINPGRMWAPSYGNGYPQQNGAYFLPYPGHQGLYYLFHKGVTYIDNYYIKGREDASYCDKFYYSLLKEDEKNGEVLKKNVVLLSGDALDPNSELINDSEMAACLHGNGRDYWMVIKVMGTNKYYFYLLDSTGVRLDHTQNIGIANTKNDWNGNSIFSKDGKKFARILPEDGLEVFEFDRCKGLFSNPRYAVFPDTALIVSSVALSASGRFAYVSSINAIWQYDLEEKNLEDGRILVDTWDSIRSPIDGMDYYLGFYQARLAPDDQIYFAYFGGSHFLHRIAKPDEKGLACESENYAVILPAYMSGSLPMFPNFKLGRIPDCVTGSKDEEIDVEIDESQIFREISIYNIQGQLQFKLTNESIYNIRKMKSLYPGIYFFYLRNSHQNSFWNKVTIFY